MLSTNVEKVEKGVCGTNRTKSWEGGGEGVVFGGKRNNKINNVNVI